MHLPEAYRSLPRPSSPLSAKASAMRPYFALKIFKKPLKRFQCKIRILFVLLWFCICNVFSKLLQIRLKKIAFPICQRACSVWGFDDLKIWWWSSLFQIPQPIGDVNSFELFNRLYGYIFRYHYYPLSSWFPATSFNHSIRKKWWRISESNRWPPACKAGALASWANPPFEWVCSQQCAVVRHGCNATVMIPFKLRTFFVYPFIRIPTQHLSHFNW